MNDLGVNGASVVAMFVALAAVLAAFWRTRRLPLAQSRERGLEIRVAELESTVKTLQGLLYEKTAQNGQLTSEVAILTSRVKELERLAPAAAPTPTAPVPHRERPALLVVLGDDPKLRIDLNVLREVEQHGWRVTRLFPVTKTKLKETLDRYRVNGRAIEYIHMAVNSGVSGLVFRDEIVTSEWLSDNLKSVKVLLINGCQSDTIGDWIGVVPTVVTMREKIGHDDAALFARLFWVAVASGLSASDAYYQAIERSPQNVAEFVELVG